MISWHLHGILLSLTTPNYTHIPTFCWTWKFIRKVVVTKRANPLTYANFNQHVGRSTPSKPMTSKDHHTCDSLRTKLDGRQN
jgi:hypothetical protein